MSRSSSSLTASLTACGSPPSSRTSASVDTESIQITGRISVANRSSAGAVASATGTGRWSASRFGTSSPSTSDRYAMTSVIRMSAIVSAASRSRPRSTRYGATSGASVDPP